MAVLMELNKIIINERNDQQIIVLREVGVDGAPGGDRKFPIVIGSDVAAAIDRRLKGLHAQRPMTHDLLANAIELLGGTIERIEINDLKEHTYYARIVIRQGAKHIDIDSRPSDAIALGIASNVPIYVEEHVLDAATS